MILCMSSTYRPITLDGCQECRRAALSGPDDGHDNDV